MNATTTESAPEARAVERQIIKMTFELAIEQEKRIRLQKDYDALQRDYKKILCHTGELIKQVKCLHDKIEDFG